MNGLKIFNQFEYDLINKTFNPYSKERKGLEFDSSTF